MKAMEPSSLKAHRERRQNMNVYERVRAVRLSACGKAHRSPLPYGRGSVTACGYVLALACLSLHAEELRYTVNLPTGLSLGEGSITATQTPGERSFKLSVDASFPGLTIRDQFSSRTTDALCSLRFEKDSTHGPRTAKETSTFDSAKGVVVRETHSGGKSELPAPGCARDVLAFLFFLRQELAAGRLPPPQTVFFGAPYEARLTRLGAQESVQADRIGVWLKGPASETNLELLFSRDPARTPLAIRVPLGMGTFSMELAR